MLLRQHKGMRVVMYNQDSGQMVAETARKHAVLRHHR